MALLRSVENQPFILITFQGTYITRVFFPSVSTDRENASFKRTSPETNILCLVAFKNSGILRRKLNDDVFYCSNRSYLVNLNTVGIWFSLLEQNGQKK